VHNKYHENYQWAQKLSEGNTQTDIHTDMITLRLVFLRSKNRPGGHKKFSLHPYKVFLSKEWNSFCRSCIYRIHFRHRKCARLTPIGVSWAEVTSAKEVENHVTSRNVITKSATDPEWIYCPWLVFTSIELNEPAKKVLTSSDLAVTFKHLKVFCETTEHKETDNIIAEHYKSQQKPRT
jgi:hypothetical protein